MSEENLIQGFEDDEPIILNITLEDGEEMPSEVIGIFEVQGREYIALLPEDDDRVLLYRYQELSDDEIDLQNIEDDSEFEAVTKEFWEIFGEEDFMFEE